MRALISLVTASWLLLVYQASCTSAQSVYHAYKSAPVYYHTPGPVYPIEYVPSLARPPSYTDRANFYPTRERNTWTQVKFPEDDLDQPRNVPYHEYKGNERKNVGEAREKYQDLEDDDPSYLDDEMMEKMQILDRILSEDENQKDLDTNSIEGRIIAETNIPEETKRVVRQVRKQRPGFFWTLAKVTFQTINDTRSAIKQISQIVSNSILPDSATSSSLRETTTVQAPTVTEPNDGNSTTTTTTKAPFVLTRSVVQNLIRRNVLGLVKLFNLEWKEALDQSELNTRQFQKELGNQIGSYLQDNPNNY